MSTGRSAAKKASALAEQSATADKDLRLKNEEKLKREKDKTFSTFVRSHQNNIGGGFFSRNQSGSGGGMMR